MSDNDRRPAITELSNGGFLAVWEKSAAGGGKIVGRYYDSSGNAAGGETEISLGINDLQPDVALLSGGTALAVWSNGTWVRARELLGENGPPTVPTTGRMFIHTDHLGTPQMLTDSAGAAVWKADYEPFGMSTPTVQTVTNNLRFPGQYFDAETGLHYNYFRDYDATVGGYVQADPIGLRGGMNLYLYANANSLRFTDPTGEFAQFLAARAFAGPISGGIGGYIAGRDVQSAAIGAAAGAVAGFLPYGAFGNNVLASLAGQAAAFFKKCDRTPDLDDLDYTAAFTAGFGAGLGRTAGVALARSHRKPFLGGPTPTEEEIFAALFEGIGGGVGEGGVLGQRLIERAGQPCGCD